MDVDDVFPDLSPYTRMIEPHALPGVLNVGWLKIRSGFKKGDVPDGFTARLKACAVSSGPFRPLVEPIRELPTCDVCGVIQMDDSHGGWIRNSEIWIPAGDVIYASPVAIIHFIEAHGYGPPEQYIRAVSNLEIDAHFDADEVYRKKLKQSDWFLERHGSS